MEGLIKADKFICLSHLGHLSPEWLMIYYRKEFSIQASLDRTRPANYRDVMLHRKLVSEEVTVLDL